MNKKGFTLIEIISVVIIVGVLLLIGIPSITKNVFQSRNTVYKTHEKTMENTGKSYMTDCLSKDGKECSLPEAGKSTRMLLKDFVNLGLITNGLEDPSSKEKYCDDENTFVVVKNTSTSSNNYDLTYEVCLSCAEYKSGFCTTYSSQPVCTNCPPPSCGEVVASNTNWTNKDVTVGVSCVGNGAECTKGVFYEKITSSAGQVQVTIRDEAGKTMNCPVNAYVDKEAPEIVIGTKDLQEGVDSWIRGTTIAEIKSKTDNLSGINTWGIGKTLKPNYNQENEVKVGNGVTTVYGHARDNAGNEGRSAPLEFKYDDAPPVIRGVSYGYQIFPGRNDLTTNTATEINVNSWISEYGEIHALRFYFGSNNAGSEIRLYEGANLINGMNVGSGALVVEMPIPSPKTFSSMRLTLSNNMVNNLTRLEVITKAQAGFWSNKDVNIYVDAYDTLSTIRDYSFDDGATYQSSHYKTYSANTSNIRIVARDKAGNTASFGPISIVNIDKSKPVCVLRRSGTVGIEDWYRSNVVVDFSSTSDTGSGVRDYSFSTSGIGSPKTQTQSTDTSGATIIGYIIDKAGNKGDCRTVVKRDTVNPSCSISLARSATSTGWYTANVDLTISPSDERSGVRDFGLAESSPSYDNIRTKTHSEDRTSTTWRGIVRDKAGNTSSCTSSSFKFDKTQPVCGAKTNERTSWANTDLTVGVNCSDATSGCTQSNFTKKLTTSGQSESVSIEIKDAAGNTRTCTDTYSKYIDKTNPVCGSQTGGRSSWGNTNVSVGVNCSDDHSGCTQTNYSKELSGEGQTESVSFTITDNVGNTTTCTNTYNKYIDKTNPTCSLSLSGSAGVDRWYRSNVKVTLTHDDNLSGVSQKGLLNDGAEEYNGLGSATRSTETTIYGTRFNGYVKDRAGNKGNCTITFKVDKTAPTCTVNVSGTAGVDRWYRSNVSLSLSSSDALSGIHQKGLKNTSGVEYNGVTTGSYSNETTTSGITYYGYVKDKAGNTASCTGRFFIDKTAPTCTVNVSGTAGVEKWYRSAVSISLTERDSLSGVHQRGLKNTSGVEYNGVTTGSRINETGTGGLTYYGYVKDKAGNTGSCSENFKIDKTAPTCSWTKTKTNTTASVDARATCSDSLSGIQSCPSSVVAQKSSLTASSSDKAGNTVACNLTVNSRYLYRKRTKTRKCTQTGESCTYSFYYTCRDVVVCPPGSHQITPDRTGTGGGFSTSRLASQNGVKSIKASCLCSGSGHITYPDSCPTKKKCETVCKKYGDVYGSWSSYTTTSCSPLGDTCERILVYY